MLRERRSIPAEDVIGRSLAIIEKLVEQFQFINANCIASYSAFDNEVDTGAVHTLLLGSPKILCLPRVEREDGKIIWHKVYKGSEMTVSPYGILEPIGSGANTQVNPSEIDLFLVPGVCFDLKGYRIGYGKGYYDKALASARDGKAFRIGLAYDFQIVEQLPFDSWDEKVDMVITEERIINFQSR